MVIYTDDIFMEHAIVELAGQATKIWPEYDGRPWQLSLHSGEVAIGGPKDLKAYLKLNLLEDGRLAATARRGESGKTRKLKPVDCYNLIGENEDMMTAARNAFPEEF